MEADLLKQIIKNTAHKTSFQIIVSGNKSSGNDENHNLLLFPRVSPGYKIIETPVNLVYLPITLDVIKSLHVSITDQDDHPLNNRNKILMIRFHIREAR